jgi:DNA-directed RNA polymerase subunit RPC12/RpoP
VSLDQFLPPVAVKPKQDTKLYVEEKCSDCGKLLGVENPEYDLRIKGIVKPYCRECAKKRLPKPKPQEIEEEKEEE